MKRALILIFPLIFVAFGLAAAQDAPPDDVGGAAALQPVADCQELSGTAAAPCVSEAAQSPTDTETLSPLTPAPRPATSDPAPPPTNSAPDVATTPATPAIPVGAPPGPDASPIDAPAIPEG